MGCVYGNNSVCKARCPTALGNLGPSGDLVYFSHIVTATPLRLDSWSTYIQLPGGVHGGPYDKFVGRGPYKLEQGVRIWGVAKIR